MRNIYILLLALLAVGCARHADERPVLCVSIEPQRWLLDQLVGDNYQTVSILANGANPESYDPTMSARMQAAKARAIFTTGQLPYETVIVSGAGDATVICDTSDGIRMLTGTHGHGHDHDTDPHIWTSARNARVMAANMLATLQQIDPTNADEYQTNYNALATKLDSIDAVTAQRLADAGVHAFAVWHPSLSYFADDYGLHQIAVGQENKEATIGNIHDAISEARDDSVRVFFFQKEYDSRQAQSINNEIGSRLVEINPLSYDWEVELTKITDELVK